MKKYILFIVNIFLISCFDANANQNLAFFILKANEIFYNTHNTRSGDQVVKARDEFENLRIEARRNFQLRPKAMRKVVAYIDRTESKFRVSGPSKYRRLVLLIHPGTLFLN